MGFKMEYAEDLSRCATDIDAFNAAKKRREEERELLRQERELLHSSAHLREVLRLDSREEEL